jgi:hypothetical protein
MATTDFVIDDTMMGQTIGPPHGYLVSLVVTTPPKVYEVPEWNPGTQRWTRGYFVLRGSGDFRDLFACNGRPAAAGPLPDPTFPVQASSGPGGRAAQQRPGPEC